MNIYLLQNYMNKSFNMMIFCIILLVILGVIYYNYYTKKDEIDTNLYKKVKTISLIVAILLGFCFLVNYVNYFEYKNVIEKYNYQNSDISSFFSDSNTPNRNIINSNTKQGTI